MNEKEEILRLSKISLILDSYEDIFSDFDPRNFLERSLSEDFLSEMKRAIKEDKYGKIELSLMVPRIGRDVLKEALIKKRLKEHFKKHYNLLFLESKEKNKKDWLIAISGISMLFAATYLDSLEIKNWYGHLFRVLLEPGGWFLGWTGLDRIFFMDRKEKKEKEFYKKMTNSHIILKTY